MIYALVGEEPFLIRRGLEKLLAERVAPGTRDFNFNSLEGSETEAEKVIEILSTLPVLAPRRLVLIRNADQIKKEEGEKIAGFLPKVHETADLVFTAGKPDRRLLFWQKVLQIAKVQEFRPLYEREVPDWIIREASAAGYRISPETARWLATSVGTDLGEIDSALQKLYLFKGGAGEISLPDVEATVSSISWNSVFDLADAVGKRDLPRALILFRAMTAAKEQPVALLGQLAWHFRTLEKVKEGEAGGISPFVLRKYQAQAGSFKKEEIGKKRDRLFAADWALKSSPFPPEILFEKLLMDLCR